MMLNRALSAAPQAPAHKPRSTLLEVVAIRGKIIHSRSYCLQLTRPSYDVSVGPHIVERQMLPEAFEPRPFCAKLL